MKNIRNLEKGIRYQVLKEFVDYDGIVHPAGENWIFETTNFLPYEDGLTLHVLKEGQHKVYRFRQIPEEQSALIDNFADYVTRQKEQKILN